MKKSILFDTREEAEEAMTVLDEEFFRYFDDEKYYSSISRSHSATPPEYKTSYDLTLDFGDETSRDEEEIINSIFTSYGFSKEAQQITEGMRAYVENKLDAAIGNMDKLMEQLEMIEMSIETLNFDTYFLGDLLDTVNSQLELAHSSIGEAFLGYGESIKYEEEAYSDVDLDEETVPVR